MPNVRSESTKSGWISNYCGLGGSGPLQHEVDAICMEHDNNYGKILESGQNPYYTWNWADKKLLKQLKRIAPQSAKERIAKLGTQAWHEFKQLTFKSSESDTERMPKRLRGDDEEKPRTVSIDSTGDPMEIEDDDTFAPMALTSDAKKRGIHETQLSRYHLRDLHQGLQNTFTTSCPMYYWDYIATPSQTIGTLATPVSAMRVRMNGLNDTTLGTVLVAGTTVPKWHLHWSQYYTHYAVTKVDYKIEVLSFGAGASLTPQGAATAYDVHWGHFAGASGDLTAPKPTTVLDLDTNKETKRVRVWPVVTSIPYWNTTSGTAILSGQGKGTLPPIISGSYVPGSKKGEIKSEQEAIQWTAVASNPVYNDLLRVWIVPSFPAAYAEGGVFFKCMFWYTVQYKELKGEYRFRNFTQEGVGSDGSQAVQT